jgi:hypothetical protein
MILDPNSSDLKVALEIWLKILLRFEWAISELRDYPWFQQPFRHCDGYFSYNFGDLFIIPHLVLEQLQSDHQEFLQQVNYKRILLVILNLLKICKSDYY